MSGQLQKALVIYDYHKKTTTEISLEKSQVVNIHFVYISVCLFHLFTFFLIYRCTQEKIPTNAHIYNAKISEH